MVDILAAFDEQDATMGSFNQGCLEFYREYFDKNAVVAACIKSAQLNEANIYARTEQLKSFIFVAYSHGSENGELLGNEGPYLSTVVNQENFRNSFIYTVSCHVAKPLGECLIANGCLSFLGYKSLFHFWNGYLCFSECANFGFFRFLENVSTKIIFSEMLKKYNEEIDKIYLIDFLVASLLRENRDALIHLGNDITSETLDAIK